MAVAQRLLAQREPRAMALVTAVQLALGSLECAGFATGLLPGDGQHRLVFAVAALLTATIAVLVWRRPLLIPWQVQYAGAFVGVSVRQLLADRIFTTSIVGAVTAQMVLLSVSVAVFTDTRRTVVFVAYAMAGWAAVCVDRAGLLHPGEWFAVAPTNLVAALLTRWLAARALQMIERDPLTGALNRGAWDTIVAHPPERCTVVVFDVDHFKQVNDRFGHAAGDALLARLATAATATLRAGDTLARIGGDEFAVLMPGAGRDGGAAFAERLLVATRPLASVTVGVAQRRPEEELSATLARADTALLEAKRSGRGRVHTEAADPVPTATGRS